MRESRTYGSVRAKAEWLSYSTATGKYRCVNCRRWTVTLDDHDDKLPPCGTCGTGQQV